jgi:thiamine-phosphate pyrophosphorylase
VKPPLPRFHAVTDERIARRPDLTELADALAAEAGPALALHARGRDLSGLEHFDLATRLSAHPPARLFVNDRLDIALACGASGVQLAAASLDPEDARRLDTQWWIGKSVHTLAEAEAAQQAGADYLLVGPVFPTATHPTRDPIASATLAAIVALRLPVIAIGGITAGKAPALKAAGVYGVAAIRMFWDAVDGPHAARLLRQEWNQ